MAGRNKYSPSGGKAVFRTINQTYAQQGSSKLGVDKIPITRCGIFSLSTLSWLSPIMWSLYRRGVGSVLCLTWWEEDTTQYNVDRLSVYWEKELESEGTERSSFGKAVYQTFRKRLICSEVIVLLAVAFSFVGSAIILRLLLDHILESSAGVVEGAVIVLGLILSELCRCLCFSLAWCLNYWNGIKVRGAVMGLLYKKILKLRSLKDKKIGELVNLCSNDGQRFFEVMVNGPFILAGPVTFIVGSVYLGVLIGPWALIGSATYFAFFILLKFVSDIMERFRSRAVSLTGDRVSLMTEVLTCMKLIKMNSWEKAFKARISEKRTSEKVALEHAYFLQSVITSLVPMVPLIAAGLMFLAYILSGNNLKMSEAFTVIALLYAISLSLGLMTHGVKTLAEASVAARRYKEILIMDEIGDGQGEITEDDLSVKICNATFSWEGHDNDDNLSVESVIGGISKDEILQTYRYRQTGSHSLDNSEHSNMERSPLLGTTEKTTQLTDITFDIKTGELIGVCGMRGSGKTSLLLALLGRMKFLSGKYAVKGRVAYVSQEPWIINGTARENILFGKVKVEEKYKRVIEACCLDKDFDTFGAGDCVEIGERGLNISGGQKQRISLARALYSDSDVYLLDDPLSSLDIQIGRHVFTHGIKRLLKGKTILFVTHHLEYLSRCSRVILMQSGKIVEMGSHPELLEADHDYADLMELYYSKYEQIQKERMKANSLTGQDRTTPQRGFSRLSRKVLSRQLSRMTTMEGLQHQYSIISTSSTVFGDYDYVDIDDVVAGQEDDSFHITCEAYKTYIASAGGYCFVALIFISFALSIGIQTSTSCWLAYWLHQGDGNSESSIKNKTSDTGSVANNPDVHLYALVYSLLIISMLIIVAIRGLVFMKILLRAATQLHKKLLQRTLYSPMKFFDKTPLGKIINRFAADMDEVDVRLPSNLELYLQYVFLLLFSLIMICILFPWDLLAVVPLSVVFFILACMFTPILQRLKFIDNLTRSPYLGHLAASVEGISTIDVYGQSQSFFKQFCEMLDMNTVPFFLFYAANRWIALFLDLMTIIVIGATGFIVVFTVTPDNSAEAGLALSFAFQITILLQYTLRFSVETSARFSSVQRITDYIENLQIEGNPAGEATPVPASWPNEGYITFSKYRMRYGDGLPLVLKGVTLNIQPKQKIGIVGQSGSGKSSLGVALFRLAEAASGAITIDGRNIRDVKLTDLRSKLTILVQDPVLFVGTVRYNLDPLGLCHSDDTIWQALEKCHIKEKVASLENKLDTLVEENGRNFSTGEKQLLCLARALLRHTKILILDEVSASIDTQTESVILNTIHDVFQDCTILMIAHRLITILDCDKVVVMDDGKVLEFDSPKVLLGKKYSKFKTMVEALKTHPIDSISEEAVVPPEVSNSLPRDVFCEDGIVSSLSMTDKTQPWFS